MLTLPKKTTNILNKESRILNRSTMIGSRCFVSLSMNYLRPEVWTFWFRTDQKPSWVRYVYMSDMSLLQRDLYSYLSS